VAIGYDEGSILVKLGREEPAMSMDCSGKLVWAKHSEIQQERKTVLSRDGLKQFYRVSSKVFALLKVYGLQRRVKSLEQPVFLYLHCNIVEKWTVPKY
jgi:hypothetical protein